MGSASITPPVKYSKRKMDRKKTRENAGERYERGQQMVDSLKKK